MTARKKKGSGLVGESLGGMLAGFDQQIMRNQPPPHELVHKGAPVRGLSGEDGGDIEIVLPGPEGSEDELRPTGSTDAAEPTPEPDPDRSA